MPRQLPFTVPVVSALAVAIGYGLLLTHATRPGDAGPRHDRLPQSVAHRLAATSGQPLLIVAAHPQCPCLPATLATLRPLLEARSGVSLKVLLFTPSSPPPAWSLARVDALCRELPPSARVDDRNGELALALGCRTSGHVLLYAPDGTLRFCGGITSGRGHVGDNPASRALAAVLAGPPAVPVETAVFGCPLQADSAPHGECCTPP